MSNNIALQIAIGLVFIYLLYSLLATTIKEFIATLFAYRERMLERGIEQMLDGKNYSYYWWQKVVNWIVWRVKYKKVHDRQDFLSRTQLKPNAQDKLDWRWKLNDKAKMFSTEILDHPLYRRAAINSKFSKKPAYLSSDTFSDILINILSPVREDKTGTVTTPVLMKDIAIQLNQKTQLNDELKKILNIYIEQANGDLQRFKLLVENWYDGTMDRVSGWYKRQASRILFFIGLSLAIIFNINTIRIVKSLSVNEDERNAFVTQAAAYMKNRAAPDTGKGTPAEIQKSYNDISSVYKKTLLQGDSVVALGWGNYGGETTSAGKISYVLGTSLLPFSSGFSWTQLIGFLITAFAISLGAPFWFDLLNKFINLRISGEKPDDSTKNTGGSKTAGLNQNPVTPNPKAFA